jgi:hypothetical protein
METNITFSFQRFMLLCKQSLIINKKLIGISVGGFSGTLFIILMVNQIGSNFTNWDNKDFMGTFAFLFFSLGIVYASLSFPAFRSKEKSMAYLLLPASAPEKFIFELVNRIIVFIILMPLLFWVVANLEGTVAHYFVPDFKNYRFSFVETLSEITNKDQSDGWAKFACIQGFLFLFIVSFTGASHFSKAPLIKTIFAFPLLAAGYALFTYLLVKIMNLKGFHPVNDKVLFISNTHEAIIFAGIAVTAINLCLLSIAYFRLKEKEA